MDITSLLSASHPPLFAVPLDQRVATLGWYVDITSLLSASHPPLFAVPLDQRVATLGWYVDITSPLVIFMLVD